MIKTVFPALFICISLGLCSAAEVLPPGVFRGEIEVVSGDVRRRLAAALVSAKAGVLIAHVESGLRSFDPGMPEEINRIVTDHLSALLLAPTAAR